MLTSIGFDPCTAGLIRWLDSNCFDNGLPLSDFIVLYWITGSWTTIDHSLLTCHYGHNNIPSSSPSFKPTAAPPPQENFQFMGNGVCTRDGKVSPPNYSAGAISHVDCRNECADMDI
eukprot:UN32448